MGAKTRPAINTPITFFFGDLFPLNSKVVNSQEGKRTQHATMTPNDSEPIFQSTCKVWDAEEDTSCRPPSCTPKVVQNDSESHSRLTCKVLDPEEDTSFRPPFSDHKTDTKRLRIAFQTHMHDQQIIHQGSGEEDMTCFPAEAKQIHEQEKNSVGGPGSEEVSVRKSNPPKSMPRHFVGVFFPLFP